MQLWFLDGTKHHHHRIFNLKSKLIIVKVIRTLVQVLIKVQQFCFICFTTSGWGCFALPQALRNARIYCKVKLGRTEIVTPYAHDGAKKEWKITLLNARDRRTQFVNNGEGNGAEILHPYKKSVRHITETDIFVAFGHFEWSISQYKFYKLKLYL